MPKSAQETSTVRFGLRWKFIAAVALQTFVIAVLVVLVQQYSTRRAIIRQTTAQGAAIADTIASTAGYYVIFGLSDDLRSIIDDLRKDETVDYADFLSAEGKILAATAASRMPEAFKGAAALGRSGNDFTAEGSDGDLHLSTRPFFESKADAANPSAAPRGFFRLALNEKHARQAVRQLALGNIVVILFAIALAVAFANAAARIVVRPILGLVTSATAISKGDLTQRTEIRSGDELGILGEGFNSMAVNLEKTIGKVVHAQGKINAVVESVGSRSQTVISRADDQRAVLEGAYAAIDQLNSGVRKITGNVESLSASSEETSSSILQMVASMEEVSRHTDSLFSSVEETASATNEMVSAINEVDRNIDYLGNFVTETSSSMVEMSASINQVESNAARSYDLALNVADAAESGMKAVRETMEGMEQIRGAVHESNMVVSRLGERSNEIGKILNVIEDVAEQTNLLALNAAILAAQAGEHGKGFSVVAAEIRDLSERTATSTKEIAALIQAVRQEVANALRVMLSGSQMVEGGVALSQEAGKALTKILDSAVKSAEMGKEIASATKEQALGSETVARSIERVQEMVKQINAATSQQASGSTHILKAVEAMRDATKYVRQATQEQKSGSTMISNAAERIIDMVHEILEVTHGQVSESEKIVRTMERVREIAEANRTSAHEMSGSIGELTDAVRGLDEEVRRFKVRS